MNLKGILQARSNLGYQLAAVVLLNLFAGFTLAGYFLTSQTLCYDNLRSYSHFRNSLHSLNYFGEIQWWDPSAQVGFPSYYLAILGHNKGTPLFVATGFFSWLLGRAGVHIPSYHSLYVVYFGFLVPLLLSTGLLLLLRQIFTDNRVILGCLILASFSPGVVFNLSDVTFEIGIYSLFFATAYLNLAKNPGKRSFWILCLSSMVLASSLNHSFLYWNLLFVPLFCVAASLFKPEPFLMTLKKVIHAVPLSRWVAASVLTILCALPPLLTYSLGGEFVRTIIEAETYGYRQLRPGNPLEVLAISTPGIGFMWTTDGKTISYSGELSKERWMPFAVGEGYRSYGYMGLLSLPLVFTGLVFGQRAWRKRLLAMMAIMGGIVAFSGYSPLFSLLLAVPSPLRSVNHFSDCTFRIGVFSLLILAAGLGIEVLLGGKKQVRRRFPLIFGTSSSFAVVLFVAVFLSSSRPVPLLKPLTTFGLMLFLIFLFTVTILWFGRTACAATRDRLVVLLMVLTLIDVSAAASWHVRNTMWDKSPPYRDPPLNVVGMPLDARSDTMNFDLVTRSIKDLIDGGIWPLDMPLVAFSRSARTASPSEVIPEPGGQELPYLTLSKRFLSHPLYAKFFKEPERGEMGFFQMLSVEQTYNTLSVRVTAEKEALFFWRDTFSPYWTARVNGKPVEIAPAFGAFKAVPIPPGRSLLEFRFRPAFLGPAFLVSYLSIVGVSALAFFPRRPSQKARDRDAPDRRSPQG